MSSPLNLLWIVPVSVIGLAAVLVYTYVVWSVPIWGAEAVKSMLGSCGVGSTKPPAEASADDHADADR